MRISVCGGHSRSIAICLLSGVRPDCFFVEGEALNHHYLTKDQWRSRFNVLISNLSKKIGGWQIDDLDLVISLPGVASTNTRGYVENELKNFGFKQVIILDDTWAVSLLCEAETNILTVIADVGSSVSYCEDHSRIANSLKIDGHGSLIGDHGSVFELTCRYFQHLCRQSDREKQCPLFESIAEQSRSTGLLLRRQFDVQYWLNNLIKTDPADWRPKFAKTGHAILKCSEFDEPNLSEKQIDSRALARNLLNQSVRDLVETVEIAILRSGRTIDEMNILLYGDMFLSKFFRDTFVEITGEKARSVEYISTKNADVIGALLYEETRERRSLILQATKNLGARS
jgi:hypothetical protein